MEISQATSGVIATSTTQVRWRHHQRLLRPSVTEKRGIYRPLLLSNMALFLHPETSGQWIPSPICLHGRGDQFNLHLARTRRLQTRLQRRPHGLDPLVGETGHVDVCPDLDGLGRQTTLDVGDDAVLDLGRDVQACEDILVPVVALGQEGLREGCVGKGGGGGGMRGDSARSRSTVAGLLVKEMPWRGYGPRGNRAAKAQELSPMGVGGPQGPHTLVKASKACPCLR